MTATQQTRRPSRPRRRHDDTPDTDAAFRRMLELSDCPERDEIRQEIVTAWMPMAHRLARRFRNRGEALEDLQQVADLGLFKAVTRYDPDRGHAFESFAVPTVVGEIKRHFRDHMWDLHVPRRVQELRNKVRTSRRELSLTLEGRSPTVAEVAEHSGLTEEEVLTGMEALESYRTLSLDAELPGSDDGYALLDTLGDAEPGFDLVLYREAVKPELERLPERERRILYLRFFQDMTQSRIAEQLGISQMHVSRLISRSCHRIHDHVEAQTSADDALGAPRRDGAAGQEHERTPAPERTPAHA